MANIEQERTETRTEIVGYRCDQCKKEVSLYEDESDRWIEISHGHKAWGSDSADSIERFNLCSPPCYLKQLAASADEVEGNEGAEVDDKPVEFVRALLKHIQDEADEAAHRMRLNYEP